MYLIKNFIRQDRKFHAIKHTFSSCWKELGCCALSIVLQYLGNRTGSDGGVPGIVEGTRNEFGETIFETISREAAALLFL
jgi:hypothetical protein